MRGRCILFATIMAVCVVGCTGQNSSSQVAQDTTQTPTNQTATSDLPPPGNPEVGKKPPMPNPINVPTPSGYKVETYASGLAVPWDMAFVSKDRIYVTERPGRVRLIENGSLRSKPYAVIDSVARGESGLMGIALHPQYPNPRYVYLMYTYSSEGKSYNRVSRFTDTGSGLTDETAIVTRIPGTTYHDGGALRFGPDGMLYVGTGDAGQPELAQDLSSPAGKILRTTPEGSVPSDNPFKDSRVYAYGLRNVQGLAWNPENGDLWATNHGPSGEFGLEAMDSVYIIKKGGNHGWPRVLGVTKRKGVVSPVLFFPGEAVPPALATFYNANLMPELRGNFFFTSLRGEHLQRVTLSSPRTISRIERWFATGVHSGKYGRLRAVVQGPDGALYVTTSNRDLRGQLKSGDDLILRISPR